ncbi:MAG: PAS domain S-box protein [Thermodesulfobacteriota bacterium]|nr:PAS domain S-box protein [Thermodesulfobacteriota bacterium]
MELSKKTKAQLIKEIGELRRQNSELKLLRNDLEQTRKEMSEMERLFDGTLDNLRTFIAILEPDGKVITVNNTSLIAAGIELEDVKGKMFYDTYWFEHSIDDRQEIKKDIENIRAGKPFEREMKFQMADRSLGWIEFSMHRIFGDRGGIKYLVAEGRPTTDRKRAEEKLRESEERYRMLFQSSPDSIAMVDRDGVFLTVNSAMAKDFGSTISELIGRRLSEVAPEEVAAHRVGVVKKVSDEGQIQVFEDKKEGEYFHNIVVPVIIPGQKDTIQVISRNITARVMMEKELKLSLEEKAHSHRLLLALSQAAYAVQRAGSPQEVYRTVTDELVGLGYQALIFTLTSERTHLAVSYLTFKKSQIQEVERLTGLSVRGHQFPVAPGSFFQLILDEGATTYTESLENHIMEALPGPKRHLAKRVSVLLGLQQCILAPLNVSREFYGLLVVTGYGLTGSDVPAVSAFANQTAIAIDNARLIDTVTKHRRDLQRLSAQIIDGQEAERKRISQELHDELGQTLTAIKINLAAIEKKLPRRHSPVIKERLAEANLLAEQTLEQVRELSLDLRPTMLDDLGLEPTLRWHVNRYARRLNVRAVFEAVGLEERLSAEIETVLYRTVQEALTNVARHARANTVRICLERKNSRVTALIEDNGRGFDVQDVENSGVSEHGAGLLGIRERIAFLGGSFGIRSRPHQGTKLSVEIPLRERSRG